jgi:hypothetical protein
MTERAENDVSRRGGPGSDREHDHGTGGRNSDRITSSGIAPTGGEPAGGAADRIQPPLAVRESASATGAADGPVPGGARVAVTDDPRPDEED